MSDSDQKLVESAISSFESKLQSGISNWVGSHSDVKYRYVNPKTAFDSVLDNYASYGAPNSSCYVTQNSNCLWFNDFHPGYQIHEAVAKEIASYSTFSAFFTAS